MSVALLRHQGSRLLKSAGSAPRLVAAGVRGLCSVLDARVRIFGYKVPTPGAKPSKTLAFLKKHGFMGQRVQNTELPPAPTRLAIVNAQ